MAEGYPIYGRGWVYGVVAGQIISRGFSASVDKLIASLERSPIVGGNLRVLGYKKYWWFLEFGTASRREIASEGVDALEKPRFGKGEGPRAPYPIDPRPDRNPALRQGIRAWLKFPSSSGGGWEYRKAQEPPGHAVMHPGAWPKPFLRRLIAEHRDMMIRDLHNHIVTQLKAGRCTRKSIVDIINTHLDALLQDVKLATPINRDIYRFRRFLTDVDQVNSPHLRDAWSVSRAR